MWHGGRALTLLSRALTLHIHYIYLLFISWKMFMFMFARLSKCLAVPTDFTAWMNCINSFPCPHCVLYCVWCVSSSKIKMFELYFLMARREKRKTSAKNQTWEFENKNKNLHNNSSSSSKMNRGKKWRVRTLYMMHANFAKNRRN